MIGDSAVVYFAIFVDNIWIKNGNKYLKDVVEGLLAKVYTANVLWYPECSFAIKFESKFNCISLFNNSYIKSIFSQFDIFGYGPLVIGLVQITEIMSCKQCPKHDEVCLISIPSRKGLGRVLSFGLFHLRRHCSL